MEYGKQLSGWRSVYAARRRGRRHGRRLLALLHASQGLPGAQTLKNLLARHPRGDQLNRVGVARKQLVIERRTEHSVHGFTEG